jgi:hypothetical protein
VPNYRLQLSHIYSGGSHRSWNDQDCRQSGNNDRVRSRASKVPVSRSFAQHTVRKECRAHSPLLIRRRPLDVVDHDFFRANLCRDEFEAKRSQVPIGELIRDRRTGCPLNSSIVSQIERALWSSSIILSTSTVRKTSRERSIDERRGRGEPEGALTLVVQRCYRFRKSPLLLSISSHRPVTCFPLLEQIYSAFPTERSLYAFWKR